MQTNIIEFTHNRSPLKRNSDTFQFPNGLSFLVAAVENEQELEDPQSKRRKASAPVVLVSPAKQLSPVLPRNTPVLVPPIEALTKTLDQLKLESSVASELQLMKDTVETWFHNETQKSPAFGYKCMWEISCGRTIKGRGNFCK
jgi:hypothetical protein